MQTTLPQFEQNGDEQDVCPNCLAEYVAEDDLCRDCWNETNGQFGVGA